MIFDAGWDAGRSGAGKLLPGGRTIQSDQRVRSATRGAAPPPILSGVAVISRTVESGSLEAEFPAWPQGGETVIQGTLTRALIEALTSLDAGKWTYRKWYETAQARLASPFPSLSGPVAALDEIIFENRRLREQVRQLLAHIEAEPIRLAMRILERLIRQGAAKKELRPEAHLNLGIAQSVVGEYDESLKSLERAESLYRDRSIRERELAGDPRAEARHREAIFHLGRVLFESDRDLDLAISRLREASRAWPNNVRAHYYLGMALWRQAERGLLNEAKQALQTYLAKGAPLGHEDEVRQLLDAPPPATR
jgi:tetratricopeptide (TPR) repeat protein